MELAVTVGSVTLASPVMTAAGTAGHGDELLPYGALSELGAVVVKSLSPQAWDGNPSPRLHPVDNAMLNAVGLQGPGVPAWIAGDLPRLRAAGARVVVSIWGRSVEEYQQAATLLAEVAHELTALEVNLSCPNLSGKSIFAHDPSASADVVAAVTSVNRSPVWAKLSPNTDRVVEVAAAVDAAGAEAVTLINTVIGLAIDPATGRSRLANGTGGLSGPAIRPVAVRWIAEVSRALPDLAVIGVGGVVDGPSAAELLVAGAAAVQVGTAIFADPRAPWAVQSDLVRWCTAHGVGRVADLTGTLRSPDPTSTIRPGAEPGRNEP